MNAENKFDLSMLDNAEKNIDNARANETQATEYLINSSQDAQERAKWEQVAVDEEERFLDKKAQLDRMREQALKEAGSMAA